MSTPVTFKRNLAGCGLLALLLFPAAGGRAQTVTQAAAGFYHSLYLETNGSLWATGWDLYGQLGNTNFDTSYPYGIDQSKQILASGVATVAAGGGHTLFVKTNGSLWVMGWNAYGQLGDGATVTFTTQTNKAEQILANGVTAVSAGLNHSLFLKTDGSLWVMGDNSYGQLGDGLTNGGNYLTNRPEQIVPGNVTAISAGYRHNLYLMSDGSLWGMGNNAYGQLGDGTFSNAAVPVKIMAGNVTAIAAGDQHSLFLKNDGSLWAMGNNAAGQLGDPNIAGTNGPDQIVAGNVTAIAAGGTHSLFLKSDGSLWVMGGNHYGQLGNGTYADTNSPVQIETGGVIAISAGYGHSLFVKTDGSLWAMGDGLNGQLGNGSFTGTNAPVKIVP